MSTKIQKQNLPLRLEAQLWSASLPTRHDCGRWKRVKGQDERQKRAPLTAFPARCPYLSFFDLTPAVVVIDGMTILGLSKLYHYPIV
jgi:hypothetical protein